MATPRVEHDRRATREPKLSISMRIEAAQAAWLTEQARERDTTISMVVRDLIAEAMSR